MISIEQIDELRSFLQESVENTVNTVEKMHQTIMDTPVDLLNNAGLSDENAELVKNQQHKMIGSIYEAIRTLNRQVSSLAADVCHSADTAESVEDEAVMTE